MVASDGNATSLWRLVPSTSFKMRRVSNTPAYRKTPPNYHQIRALSTHPPSPPPPPPQAALGMRCKQPSRPVPVGNVISQLLPRDIPVGDVSDMMTPPCPSVPAFI